MDALVVVLILCVIWASLPFIALIYHDHAHRNDPPQKPYRWTHDQQRWK